MSGQPKRRNPTWARVDTSLLRSPKVLRLLTQRHGSDALITWIDSLLWSQEHLTDGGIPHWWRPATGKLNGHTGLLTGVGLWTPVTDELRTTLPGDETSPVEDYAWVIGGFHDYGWTRDEWVEEGARRTERARRGAEKRWRRDDP